MYDFVGYLKDEMGLPVSAHEWSEAADLPLYLAKAASYWLCICNRVEFVIAEIRQEASLPDLKRIAFQVSARTCLPVALVAQIDPRQRKALVSQGVPFIVPGKQAYLPMLGFAANNKHDPAPLTKLLAPGAQAVLVTLVANSGLQTSDELIKATSMPPSSISRALDDLARRGLINKSKNGREVVIERCGNRNDIVKKAIEFLRDPVARVVLARRDEHTDLLPMAGESALSSAAC